MDRKGIIRIIEASISIIIVIAALFFVFIQSNSSSVAEEDYNELARDLLEEIAITPKMRQAVLTDPGVQRGFASPDIDEFLAERLKEYPLNYSYKICKIDDACGPDRFIESEDIFAQERVISGDVTKPKLAPKKIRLFLWKKT